MSDAPTLKFLVEAGSSENGILRSNALIALRSERERIDPAALDLLLDLLENLLLHFVGELISRPRKNLKPVVEIRIV